MDQLQNKYPKGNDAWDHYLHRLTGKEYHYNRLDNQWHITNI